MIFEHLQRMVQENQLLYQNEGLYGAEGDEEEFEQEVYGEEEPQADGSDYSEEEEANPNYSYQDPVQEVCTEDEQDQSS